MRFRVCIAAMFMSLAPGAAGAGQIPLDPWSATLYAGPATNSFFTRILAGRFHTTGGMAGIAVDRRLFNLGSGFTFDAEAQITQYALGKNYTTGALGVGVRYNCFPWSLGLYTGPSYALHPPDGLYFHRKALLNYVGVEFSYAIPHLRGWDLALRIYHRSGAWGVYSQDADEGSMIGIGIRRRF